MNRSSMHKRIRVLMTVFCTAGFMQVHAGDDVWRDTPADGAWENTANWVGGTPPGATGTTTNPDTATFSSSSTTTTVVPDADRNIGGIAFSGTPAAYTIGTTGGNALRLSSGGQIQTESAVDNTQTINAPLSLQGNGGVYTFTSDASNSARLLNFGGAISGVASTDNTTILTLNGANTGNNMIGGVVGDGDVGGDIGLVKNGSGRWCLSGANVYSGGTALNEGTLLAYDPTAFGTGTITINGGMIGGPMDASLTMTANNQQIWGGSFKAFARYTRSFNIGTGSVLMTDNITITGVADQWSAPFIVGGSISDNGNGYAITIRGESPNPGILSFSGDNTFSGGVILESGTLTISSGKAIGTGPLIFRGGHIGTPHWNSPATLEHNNLIVFDGSVMTRGGTGSINFGNGEIRLTGNRSLSLSNSSITFPNAIVNSGGTGFGLTVNFEQYSATLNLGGNSTFDGGLTLNTASNSSTETLNLTNLGTGPQASPLGLGPLTLNRTGGTLRINNNSGADGTISTHNAQIWNADAFSFVGSHSLNTGTNSVTLGNDVVVNALAKTLTVGGPILEADATPRSLTKAGAGTLVLAGAGSYQSGTVIQAGLLAVAPGGTLGTGPVTVAPSALLRLEHDDCIANDADVTLQLEGGNAGRIELAASVVERVGSVTLDATLYDQPGMTFGAVGTGSTVESNDYFAGTGQLKISAPTVTVILIH